jgi:hypothetical protein
MTLADLETALKGFDAAEKAIAEIYSAKTGTDTDTLRSMMTEETWMVGKEAVDKGFADTLLTGSGPEMTISANRKVLLAAGVRHDVKGFRNIPEKIPITKGGEMPMQTLDELRAAYPELVAQAEAEAVRAAGTDTAKTERDRIREIEDIAPAVGSDALVREAKYGDNPCTAGELALRAMKEQSKLGAAHLANVKADSDDSGAGEVGASPNGGDSGESDDTARAGEVNAVVNAYKSTKKGGKK